MKQSLILIALVLSAVSAFAQGTAFTYQGRLNDGGNPASGNYDLTFSLFDAATGSGQIGGTLTNSPTVVSNGLFNVVLDFGANFSGADRWLEITARPTGGGSFTNLAPRQKITPTPYAITANNLSGMLPVANGGTAATTAATARTSLGAAASGSNTDITSLSLTTPLSLVQGGTGAGTAASALSNLGAPSLNGNNTFTGTETIQPSSAAASGLVVRGAAGQSANLQEWRNSAGTTLASVGSSGAISGNGAALTSLNPANLSGTVAVANGGTAATTAAAARTNLGLGTLATVSPSGTANSTTFLRGDSTWAAAGAGAPVFAARATNLILNSSTMVDVISISLEASKTYSLEAVVLGQRVGGTSSSGNFNLVYSGSATTDYGLLVSANWLQDTTIDSTASFDLDAALIPANFTSSVGARLTINGYIRTTTAGTLTIRGARAAANTTVDLNVREGSYFIARPLN